MKNFIVLAIGTVLATTAWAQRNPVGEKAHYQIDTNRARTSGVVRNGTVDATVESESETGFSVKIDYDINVVLQGRQQGSQALEVPKDFFTPAFLIGLRERGTYVSEQFKVKHEGYADAANMDGHRYAHCDKLKIYDIKTEQDFWAVELLAAAGDAQSYSGDAPSPIQDLIINVMVFEGVPVLGGVKIDMAGKYNGMNVKVGADYMP